MRYASSAGGGCCGPWNRICRWQPAISPFLASMAFNNLLPLRAGDALRVLGFRRQLRSPPMRVLGTLVVERALDLVFLSGIFFVCLLGLPAGAFPQHFVTAAAWLAGVGMAVLLASMLLLSGSRDITGRAIRYLCERMSGRFFFVRRHWLEALYRQGAHLSAALGIVRSTPRMLILIALSAVVWVCEGGAFVVLAATLMPGAAPLGPWLSLSAGTLATAIPSGPGYVGTFDYFAALGFAAYGAAPEIARRAGAHRPCAVGAVDRCRARLLAAVQRGVAATWREGNEMTRNVGNWAYPGIGDRPDSTMGIRLIRHQFKAVIYCMTIITQDAASLNFLMRNSDYLAYRVCRRKENSSSHTFPSPTRY